MTLGHGTNLYHKHGGNRLMVPPGSLSQEDHDDDWMIV